MRSIHSKSTPLCSSLTRGKREKVRTSYCIGGARSRTNFLTCYLRNHLKQSHGIRNSQTLNKFRKNAEIYQPNRMPSKSTMSATKIEEDDTEPDDDDDDDDYELPGAKAFFETRHINTDCHSCVVDFYLHLGTVDASQKAERIRLQHANQVRKILGHRPRG